MFSCDFEVTEFNSFNANVQVTSPSAGMFEEKILNILKIPKNDIQTILDLISPKIASSGCLSKITKLMVFLMVVKENIPIKVISTIILTKEAKISEAVSEVLKAISSKSNMNGFQVGCLSINTGIFSINS